MCDAFLNEGLHACGDLFKAKVAFMTEAPAHIDDREWMAFIVHAAGVVPFPDAKPQPAPSPPAPAVETEEEFRARLARMVADRNAKKAAGGS